MDAFTGMMSQYLIMFPHCFRNKAFRCRKVIELCYIGNIDFLRAGQAMIAVHTVPFPADIGETGKCLGVIPFLLRKRFIADIFP